MKYQNVKEIYVTKTDAQVIFHPIHVNLWYEVDVQVIYPPGT